MKVLKKIQFCCFGAVLLLLFPQTMKAQYQFGYLSYKKALQNMPEYAKAQSSLSALKEKYDNEAKYNEEKFKKMFADFLEGQKTFPQEIMLKRQKELQVAMEQGISFREDAQRMLSKAEDEMLAPIVNRLDSILGQIGKENGLIFILNTDNRDFPFIHTQAGKDLQEIVVARIEGKIIPLNEEQKENENSQTNIDALKQESAAAQQSPTTSEKKKQ